ncbi:MAG TPA: hypothetical protein DEF64_05070, partial [Ruminococcaceae bacterium]|nr:hypothetical protein [Oscillospiraceae bacterium]
LGLPPLVPVGGFAPKQGCFGCLPKVLHDAKPTEQAISDTPFLNKQEVFSTDCTPAQDLRGGAFYIKNKSRKKHDPLSRAN